MKPYIIPLLLLFQTLYMNAQVVVTRNIDYIGDAVHEKDKDLLDIYMPKGKKEVPVVVYFHGGALLRGNKSLGVNIGLKVAEKGVGLISANYRLSPDFQHPMHVNDAAAATAWVLENIATYGGDPKKVYVCGHSAGGYLAALIAIDSTLKSTSDILYNQIKGTIPISPFLYVEETAKDRIEKDPIHTTIWSNDPQKWGAASVTPHILPRRDNILLIYADGDEDWRKEQNERFAKAMSEAGNSQVRTEEVPNRDHSSLLTAILENDDQVVDLILEFIANDK